MKTRTKVTLASGIAGALLAGLLVAGAAFAAPKPVAAPVAPEAVSTTVPDTDSVQSGSQADDPTEAKGAKSESAGESKSAGTETDGVDHQFEGQETGENGVGTDAPGTK